jgi:hypothetical protein
LEEDEPAFDQAAGLAERKQLPVRPEAVAGRVDRALGLIVVLRVLGPVLRLFGQVRQVGDDEIDRHRHRLEQVPFEHVHAIVQPLPLDVLARERDRVGIDVGRPNLGRGSKLRDCDRHGAGSRADVDNAQRLAVEPPERGVDERLGRRTRSEHPPRRGRDRNAVENGFHRGHAAILASCPRWIGASTSSASGRAMRMDSRVCPMTPTSASAS